MKGVQSFRTFRIMYVPKCAMCMHLFMDHITTDFWPRRQPNQLLKDAFTITKPPSQYAGYPRAGRTDVLPILDGPISIVLNSRASEFSTPYPCSAG